MNNREMHVKTTAICCTLRNIVLYSLGISLGLSCFGARVMAQQSVSSNEVAEVRSLASSVNTGSASATSAQDPLGLGAMVFKGAFEVGARGRDVGGNEDVYRSQVNLGNGLRLYHASMELSAPEGSGRLFDRLSVNLDNWGGDPYNTTQVRVKKNLWYDFQYRYQKIDYFNFIPEFANPLFDPTLTAGQAGGALLGQHSYDSTRRMSNARLDILPGSRRFQAYVSYGRNSAYGPAFTTTNLGGDEFLVNRLVKNTVNDYRFGFDVKFWKLNLGFEQGFREFRDDQGNDLPGNFSLGNNPDPIFDFQQLFLTEFFRSYYNRGFIPTTRVALSSYRIPRIVFNARLYYSDAEVDYDFSRTFSGVVLNRETGIFASDGYTTNHAAPGKPYTVADGTVRVNVTRRFSLMNTFRGAHYVINGTRVLNEAFTDNDFPDFPVEREETSYRYTFLNSYMNQFEGDYAITNDLVVRAGYRYHRRHVILRQRDLAFDSIVGPDFPTLNRMRDEDTTQSANTALVGGSYRLRRFIRVAVDYERGEYLTEFARVDPREFQRGRFRLQFNPMDQWRFTVYGTVFDQTRPNRSLALPDQTLQNRNRSRSGGFSVSWFPTQRFALDLDYTRSHILARINTLNLLEGGTLRPQILYLEDSNVLHSGVDITLFKGIRTAFGYRLVNSNGSYPISYHRPYAHLMVPLNRVVSFNIGYQHYGYNEHGWSVQDYRANLVDTGLKFSF